MPTVAPTVDEIEQNLMVPKKSKAQAPPNNEEATLKIKAMLGLIGSSANV